MPAEFGKIAALPAPRNPRLTVRLNRRVADFVARIPARIETKLLVAFSGIVALLILLGGIGLGVLSELNRHTEDIIATDREVAELPAAA
jgi:hypothetical protein